LNSWTAEQFNLPGEMNVNGIVATNVISCGGNVYVSGKDPDKATTVRTFIINLTTNSAQRVELPSNITHSSSDGIRVLAKTEDQSMYILEDVNAYQFDGVKARAFWDKGNDTILCAYGEES